MKVAPLTNYFILSHSYNHNTEPFLLKPRGFTEENLVHYNGFIAFYLTLQLLFSSLPSSAELTDALFSNSSYAQVDRIGALESNIRRVTWKKFQPFNSFHVAKCNLG